MRLQKVVYSLCADCRPLRYACYRAVHQVTIHYYRDQGMAAEIDARRRLTSILAEMASVDGICTLC